jgi:hypothetical protein
VIDVSLRKFGMRVSLWLRDVCPIIKFGLVSAVPVASGVPFGGLPVAKLSGNR